jgi:hypothetical protein
MRADVVQIDVDLDRNESVARPGLPDIRKRFVAGEISVEQAIQLSEETRRRALADEGPPF